MINSLWRENTGNTECIDNLKRWDFLLKLCYELKNGRGLLPINDAVRNKEEGKMELGDMVIVDYPRHPLYGCEGKIIGKRGKRNPDDIWILIYIVSKMRDYLVPQSMLRLMKNEADRTRLQ